MVSGGYEQRGEFDGESVSYLPTLMQPMKTAGKGDRKGRIEEQISLLAQHQ